jgi:hypothetical protein
VDRPSHVAGIEQPVVQLPQTLESLEDAPLAQLAEPEVRLINVRRSRTKAAKSSQLTRLHEARRRCRTPGTDFSAAATTAAITLLHLQRPAEHRSGLMSRVHPAHRIGSTCRPPQCVYRDRLIAQSRVRAAWAGVCSSMSSCRRHMTQIAPAQSGSTPSAAQCSICAR